MALGYVWRLDHPVTPGSSQLFLNPAGLVVPVMVPAEPHDFPVSHPSYDAQQEPHLRGMDFADLKKAARLVRGHRSAVLLRYPGRGHWSRGLRDSRRGVPTRPHG